MVMKKIIKKYFIWVGILSLIVLFTYKLWPTTSGRVDISHEPTVKIVEVDGKYQLMRNGEPYFIKGAGTFINLQQVKEMGGNSIRVWDTSDATRILDEAHELGLTVNLGIWVTRQKEGFSFYNNKLLEEEFKRIRHIVMRYKDHPALLMWSIGNEMSAGNPGIRMWDSLNEIAKMIHQLDGNHPVTTPVFGIGLGSLRAIKRRCPNIDLLSFNVYGSLGTVTEDLKKSIWQGPYVISEFGAKGYWESPKTSWNEPFEQTSSEKAEFIKERYGQFIRDNNACLGSYIFFWGNKMEKTHTWFSLFSPEGEKTEVVDLMKFLWTDEWPENTAPVVKNFFTKGYQPNESIIVPPGSILTTAIEAFDKESDSLAYHWEILPEIPILDGSVQKIPKPRPIRNLLISEHLETIQWKAPEDAGPYRLFVIVSDGNHNIATANVPFMVSSGDRSTNPMNRFIKANQ
jgi:hypothetical protein